jgi:peptidoglycan/LPS O-acetylase OafA/YrhL
VKSHPPDYLPSLDGWRAVAISMVLFAHTRLPGNALQSLATYGAVGVHLFFAISGFLITDRLIQEQHRTGRVNLRSFYIRRAFRILPAALTYLAALCLLGFVFHLIPVTKGQIVSAALFFRNYWVEPAAQSWYTGHYWSLSVEEHFYLLWPTLLVLVGTRRARWMTPALACVFAAWRALDSHFAWVAALNPALRDLVGRTDYRLDGLFWGCSAAFLWDWAPAREWLRRRGRAEYALLAAGAAALLLMAEPPGYLALFAFLLPVPILFTASHPRGWFGGWFERPWIAWFGRLSYSVYLWQMLFMTAYGIPLSLGVLQHFPGNLLLAIACACASYYVVERPCRRIGVRLASQQPVAEVA